MAAATAASTATAAATAYRNPDFDHVTAKADALRILRDELARKVRPAFIGMGAMSDPYNPFEEELLLTRHALELIDAYDCGVSVDTKSDLIVRDVDLYQSIQAHSPVICKITVTTVDEELAAKVSPGPPPPPGGWRPSESWPGRGSSAGCSSCLCSPFWRTGRSRCSRWWTARRTRGAKFIYSGFGVTMRQGQREYFLRELDRAFPGENLSRRYLARYGDRYRCPSPRARELWEVFTAGAGNGDCCIRCPTLSRRPPGGMGTGS